MVYPLQHYEAGKILVINDDSDKPGGDVVIRDTTDDTGRRKIVRVSDHIEDVKIDSTMYGVFRVVGDIEIWVDKDHVDAVVTEDELYDMFRGVKSSTP